VEKKRDRRTFIWRVDSNDILVFANKAWLDFAQENGAGYLTQKQTLDQSLWASIYSWVEVEEGVKALDLFQSYLPPKISHGICLQCGLKYFDL
jgi:hypothetical protein